MRLKELRDEKGINQKDVAAFINKTVQSYSYYERGERNPDIDTLKKLAEYFGVTIAYLLGESNIRKETKQLPPELSRIAEQYHSLTEKKRNAIKAILDLLED